MIFSYAALYSNTCGRRCIHFRGAQTARAGALLQVRAAQRLRATFSIVVALLASSLRHANNLSRALTLGTASEGFSCTFGINQPLALARQFALGVTVCFVALIFVLA